MLICETDLWSCDAESSQQIMDYTATKFEDGVVSFRWIVALCVRALWDLVALIFYLSGVTQCTCCGKQCQMWNVHFLWLTKVTIF